MLAIGRTLIISTILKATPFAWADNAIPQNSTIPTLPNGPVHVTSRINFPNYRLLNETDKPGSEQPSFRTEENADKGKIAPSNVERPKGLNWNLSGPHPGLEYRFSENGAVRFHVGKHGTAANAAWRF